MDIQEVFIRDGEDVLVTKFPVVGKWTDITKNGKPLKKSIIQKDLRNLLEVSDIANVLWTRRGGKSTELADNFLDKIIMKGSVSDNTLMKHKKRFIASHPVAQDLQKNFMEQWLPLPFGGASELNADLNKVWIPLPEKYLEIITNPDITEVDIKWWFGDPSNKQSPIIRNYEGKMYVKLFKTDVGSNMSKKSSENIYRGVFFNGAILELISANYNFDNYVSGGDIAGFWGEEVGNWDADYISEVAMPAIISAGGFVQLSWTPAKVSEPKKHWTYKKFIEPIAESVINGDYSKVRQHGVDYYISTVDKSYSVVVDGQIVKKSKKSINFISLAKFSECFPYAHGGIDTFMDVAVNCQERIEAKEKLDDSGNIIINSDGLIEYDIVIDNKSLNKTRKIEPVDRLREYEISFSGLHEDRVFYAFSDSNIIPRASFDPSPYTKIMGFDKGVSKVDEDKGVILGTREQFATYWCKIARTGLNQWVIYEEGLMNFIYEEVGKLFLRCAIDGIPVVYDSSMKSERGRYSKNVPDSDIYQVMKTEPKLLPSYKNGVYHKYLIPCKKRENVVKIEEFNKMFQEQELAIPALLNPITGLSPASQIYITDNCKIAIAQFEQWYFKINKEGARVRAKVREDAWDASSYPIDTFMYDEKKRNVILANWRAHKDRVTMTGYDKMITRRPNALTLTNYANRGTRI